MISRYLQKKGVKELSKIKATANLYALLRSDKGLLTTLSYFIRNHWAKQRKLINKEHIVGNHSRGVHHI